MQRSSQDMVVKILHMEKPVNKLCSKDLSRWHVSIQGVKQINKFRNAMYDFDEKEIREVLSNLLSPDTIIHMPWPLPLS